METPVQLVYGRWIAPVPPSHQPIGSSLEVHSIDAAGFFAALKSICQCRKEQGTHGRGSIRCHTPRSCHNGGWGAAGRRMHSPARGAGSRGFDRARCLCHR
eukprot:1020642-Prymnesium_polylepis.1